MYVCGGDLDGIVCGDRDGIVTCGVWLHDGDG